MHGAKGLEWEAVALIGLHEGQIPNYRARSQDEIDEHCRLLYVGITRAKRFLLYVTDRASIRNVPSRFLNQIGLVPA
jgi:DNA helicase-2/ATP-dependent DNA helicase PcrA